MKFFAAALLLASLQPARSQGPGSTCSNDFQCSTGACGREEALVSAGYVCCEIRPSRWPSSSLGKVCTNLPTGAACNGESSLCATGVCGASNFCVEEEIQNEIPASTTVETPVSSPHTSIDDSPPASEVVIEDEDEDEDEDEEGKTCYRGYQCSSGICDVENGCSNTKLPDGSRCSGSGDNNNCISGACAVKPGDSSKYICCYDGESKKGTSFLDSMNNVYYCVGQVIEEVIEDEEEGKPCSAGYQCSSGICDVENGCSTAKLRDGSQCSSSVDDDNCISGKCARVESLSSKNVCCDDGESMYVSVRNTVCKNLPAGSKCSGKNDLCASGRCGFDGYCADTGSVPVGSPGIDSFEPPKALDGTVLCNDGVTQGYATLSKLNFEANKYGLDNASERTFVLCPGTYQLSEGNYQLRTHQITLRNGQTVQCGEDGASTDKSGNARCIISGNWGQTDQVSVVGDASNIRVKGLTFEATSSKSLGTTQSRQNTVSFVDCHWNFGGSSRTYVRSHLSVSMAVSFDRCTFKGNSPNEHLIAISYPGTVSINESVFLSNQPSNSLIQVETGSELSVLRSCFVDNSVGDGEAVIKVDSSAATLSIPDGSNYFYQNRGGTCSSGVLSGTGHCQSISSAVSCIADDALSAQVGSNIFTSNKVSPPPTISPSAANFPTAGPSVQPNTTKLKAYKQTSTLRPVTTHPSPNPVTRIPSKAPTPMPATESPTSSSMSSELPSLRTEQPSILSSEMTSEQPSYPSKQVTLPNSPHASSFVFGSTTTQILRPDHPPTLQLGHLQDLQVPPRQ